MSAFDLSGEGTASGDAASVPQGNFLTVGTPPPGATFWLKAVLAQDSCKLFWALPDPASVRGPYLSVSMLSDEEFAHVLSPQQV